VAAGPRTPARRRIVPASQQPQGDAPPLPGVAGPGPWLTRCGT
jgi:hypothetical protein